MHIPSQTLESDQLQLLSPEVLQLYIQQLLQQQATQAGDEGEEDGDQNSVSIATGLIQQVRLLPLIQYYS